MKKLLTLVTAFLLCAAVCLGGCISGKDGVDGKNGSDVSIIDIWNEVNAARVEEGLDELSFLDFISEYLSYDGEQLTEATSLKSSINRSLMSSVTVLSNFGYTLSYGSSKINYNEVFTGSGVIIEVDKEEGDAYVVTNCHVVYSSTADQNYSSDVHLYLYGKEDYTEDGAVVATVVAGDYSTCVINDTDWGMKAEIVAASVTYDLAVLKVTGSDVIKNSDVYAASFVDEDILDAGETVYAIGNAEGEGMGVTTGVISVDSEYIELDMSDSAVYSDKRTYRVLRTDAAVNSGNSGGGLFNSDGELVGIVNAKTANSEVDNMGYAIPACAVKRVIANMLAASESGDSTNGGSYGLYKAYLGITPKTDIVDSGIDSNGIAYKTEAAVVDEVTVDAAAYNKLEKNDIITHLKVTGVDGTVREDMDITRVYLLKEGLLSVRVNDTLTLTIKRNGEYKDIDFTFTELTYVD